MKRKSHFSGLHFGAQGMSAEGPYTPYSEELTETGTVTPGVQSVELNHATVAIDATLAAPVEGFFIVKNTSASGTAGHNLTLTTGTFDGTNSVVTFDAPNDALVVYFDSAGNGTIIENVGTAVLS
jgi:hypothetical protein